MMLKLVSNILVVAVAISSTVALNSELVFSQTPRGSSSNLKTVFRCLKNADGNTYSTVATRGNKTPVPIINWTSREFGASYTPDSRCKAVTNRFNHAVTTNGGKLSNLFLTFGKVGRERVICFVNGKSGMCTSKNILFTLRQQDYGREKEILEQLSGISAFGTGSPIQQGNRNMPYINMEEWVEEKLTPETETNSPNSSPSESENKEPTSSPSI
ncbi:MAG: hypothetical protein HC903_11915 [Methylacidiphilales bacterium]|nr:hypothetical protein [Candidatus Methylacidiphilales bacterium]NJR17782.1 hypothetical protein [Calothrix sp. CSU_2_0]